MQPNLLLEMKQDCCCHGETITLFSAFDGPLFEIPPVRHGCNSAPDNIALADNGSFFSMKMENSLVDVTYPHGVFLSFWYSFGHSDCVTMM